MKKNKWLLIICLFANWLSLHSQALDSVKFFKEDSPIEMTLTTDMRNLQTEKKLNVYQPANAELHFTDNTVISEGIRLCSRGHFRRENCRIPPILLNFHNPTSPRLNNLGKLKLVIGCGNTADDEQMIFKEYLAYKIYNLLEEQKSYRVRLLKVNYVDTKNKVKPFTQSAFLVEDDGDMAKRNKCIKKEKSQVNTESTDRNMMTMVAVFEYFIGNTDWSVPGNHNATLIYSKSNEQALPYVVPYDFDFSGIVNTSYAVPSEIIGTEKVTERVYRGYPRTMEELELVLDIYRKQKDNIYSLITNFTLLKDRTKKEMTSYLDEFYKMINSKSQVKSVFIDNARKD